MTTIETLQEKINKFEKVQKQFSGYGASDTEPNYRFNKALIEATKGNKVIPKNGNEWELYTASMDCSLAAENLTKACEDVVGLILNSGKIIEYIKNYI